MPALLLCLAAVAADGDSIRCSNLRQLRPLGMDSADDRSSRPSAETMATMSATTTRRAPARPALYAEQVNGILQAMIA
jgi:hypothetical protein